MSLHMQIKWRVVICLNQCIYIHLCHICRKFYYPSRDKAPVWSHVYWLPASSSIPIYIYIYSITLFRTGHQCLHPGFKTAKFQFHNTSTQLTSMYRHYTFTFWHQDYCMAINWQLHIEIFTHHLIHSQSLSLGFSFKTTVDCSEVLYSISTDHG